VEGLGGIVLSPVPRPGHHPTSGHGEPADAGGDEGEGGKDGAEHEPWVPIGEGGRALDAAFPRFADDLSWWMEAAKAQRKRKEPPY